MTTPGCDKCGDSGWRPHYDANGNRVWLPFMNDALPCECGALQKRYAAQRAMVAQRTEGPLEESAFVRKLPTF